MLTERQIQIIEIAKKLISKKGIQGFTIKNLANEIGISEPAIYRHFENKTAILITILDDFKAMVAIMFSSFQDSDLTAIRKIELLFFKMLAMFSEQPTIISVILSEEIYKNDTVLKNKIIEIQNTHQAKIEAIIATGQAANNVRKDMDKSTLALTFMGSFRLLVKRWDLNNHNFDLEEEGAKLINSFKSFI